MKVLAPYLYTMAISGFVACWMLAVAAWVNLAVVFFPFWLKTLELYRESRSQLSGYFYAPKSSHQDSWIKEDVRQLLPFSSEIKKRMLRFFACGLSGFAFGALGAVVQNYK